MAISDILEIGRQALAANRQALQTTSNNIANVNTPGYSRQRAQFSSNEQSVSGGVRIGGGVDIKAVSRAHDQFVHHQLIDESRAFGAAKMRFEGVRRLEGAVNNEGFQIGDLVNKFFNDVRELSANPETTALKTSVAISAENTASGFRKMYDSLQAIKSDIDNQISFSIDQVNSLTKELASLNENIQRYEASGESPNDLYDRRDQVQRDLSVKLGFQTFTDDHGNVNLSAGGLGVIVQGADRRELVALRTPGEGKKEAGSLDVFVKEANGLRNVTSAMVDGEVGGLVQVRDEVVNGTLNHLNKAAYEFANQVNAVHKEGVGSDGISGRGLFKDLNDSRDAAHFLEVSDEIKKGYETVAVGYSSDAAGDNRIALKIAELQNQKIMPLTVATSEVVTEGATQTLNDSLNTLVGKVAMTAQAEEQNLKHQEAVVNQLESYRQSISGVSLEEEAINLMQFQATFNAAAKAMKVGDELLDTILSLKR